MTTSHRRPPTLRSAISTSGSNASTSARRAIKDSGSSSASSGGQHDLVAAGAALDTQVGVCRQSGGGDLPGRGLRMIRAAVSSTVDLACVGEVGAAAHRSPPLGRPWSPRPPSTSRAYRGCPARTAILPAGPAHNATERADTARVPPRTAVAGGCRAGGRSACARRETAARAVRRSAPVRCLRRDRDARHERRADWARDAGRAPIVGRSVRRDSTWHTGAKTDAVRRPRLTPRVDDGAPWQWG